MYPLTASQPGPGPAKPGPDRPRRGRSGRALVFLLVLAGLMFPAAILAYQALLKAAPVPPTETSGQVALTLDRAGAPDFALRDARGEETSLDAVRGKVVLLAFLDGSSPQRPALVQQYLWVQRRQGEAGGAVFLGIDVSAQTSTASVEAATQGWGLSTTPGWRFLTGSPETIAVLREQYRRVAPASADTEGVFVIDAAGRLAAYLAPPPRDPLATSFGDLLERELARAAH